MHFQNRSVTRDALLHMLLKHFSVRRKTCRSARCSPHFHVAARLCSRRQYADLLLTGGVVWTGDAASPVADAVAIRDAASSTSAPRPP
jgi:hypothetical protein